MCIFMLSCVVVICCIFPSRCTVLRSRIQTKRMETPDPEAFKCLWSVNILEVLSALHRKGKNA